MDADAEFKMMRSNQKYNNINDIETKRGGFSNKKPDL